MPIMTLLMALAQAAAAPAPPPTPPALPWHVFGVDSEWTLDIADGRMVFAAKGKPPVSAPAGAPVLGEEGWTWKGGGLTVVAGGTEGGCGRIAAQCAARFWQILAEPVAIAFADRNHLTLTGKSGTIRLQTPDEEHLFSPRSPTPCTAAPA